MFETQTYTEILRRLKSEAPSTMDSAEGSFIHDVLSPAALELAQLYAELDQVLALSFAQTTSGQYLDYRAGEHGLIRKPAERAKGTITVTGNEGVTLELGTVFVTEGGIEFAATELTDIPAAGYVDIPIQAVNPGLTGNVPDGVIKKAQAAIPGVTAVTNEAPTTGGVEEETDEDLLARLLEKVRNPVTSGNAAHYLQWAKEVTGVGEAKVFPLWAGAGTVRVVIINSQKEPDPDSDAYLVTDVYHHISGVMPIGPDLSVEPAEGLNLDIEANVTLAGDEGYENVEQVIPSLEGLLSSYLKEIALQQNFVSYARIGSIILSTPGILDYTGLTVNGGAANIPVDLTAENCRVAVPGTVTLNV